MAKASNDPNHERQEYLEERKLLIGLQDKASQSFDKAVITLSASALGLSITFLKQVVVSPKSGSIVYLHAAWILLGLTLVIMLVSFLFSMYGMRRLQRILDVGYEGELEAQSKGASQNMKNMWGIFIHVLNLLSLVCFIVGIAAIIYFSILNT